MKGIECTIMKGVDCTIMKGVVCIIMKCVECTIMKGVECAIIELGLLQKSFFTDFSFLFFLHFSPLSSLLTQQFLP